jgi:glycosyltransferase involved in cell wall biosynthesis
MITFVLPCYNERELAEVHIGKLRAYLAASSWEYEILVCDDSSTDGTAAILDGLSSEQLRVLHYTNGPSRRENLGLTMKEGRGDILVYMDMDLATSLDDLPTLVQAVESGQYEIAVGSRYRKGAVVKRTFLRLLYSILYNRMIRLLLGSRLLDHQCGFKAFRKDVFHQLLQDMGYDSRFVRGWFWDAELLIRAQRKGYRILEMPVHWTSAAKSSFSFTRELKVIPYMVQLRRRL